MDVIEKYLHNLYAVQPDFLYSVSRDFIGNCRTPMLVLPDDVPGHPLQTSIDIASLAPNAEITVSRGRSRRTSSNARSTAGYYAWRSRLPSARAIADDALLRRLRTIHAVSRGTYGAPRVHAELRAE